MIEDRHEFLEKVIKKIVGLKPNMTYDEIENLRAKLKLGSDVKTKNYEEEKSKMDTSIIDITSKNKGTPINKEYKKYPDGVPFWKPQPIETYIEIKKANLYQRLFYNEFKEKFYQEVYYDLEENYNYASILMKEFKNFFDSDKFKYQKYIKTLGYYYPSTKKYGDEFLAMRGMMNSNQEKIETTKSESYQIPEFKDYENSYFENYNFGNKFKKLFNLNYDEVEKMNLINFSHNQFCLIKYFRIEILRLFINSIRELNNEFIKLGSSLEIEIEKIIDEYHNFYNSKRFKLGKINNVDRKPVSNHIYYNLFKYSENKIRETFGKKNLHDTFLFSGLKTNYEDRIISRLLEVFNKTILNVVEPTEMEEIQINAEISTRWKIKFELLKTKFKGNVEEFYESILTLGKLNSKNKSLSIIYFETAKFLVPFDKEKTLHLYIYSIFNDIKNNYSSFKQFSATLRNKIFTSKKQMKEFESIINQLIATKDLDWALSKITEIYKVERKKINLDIEEIKTVHKKHSETVEVLNEFLKDEEEVKTKAILEKRSKKKNIPKKMDSIYSTEINFTDLQIETLDLFMKNNLQVSIEEISNFAKEKSVFKNQLIESINEYCYEYIDDVLIEEEDEFYTINENYSKRILKE